jgi:hypothetical protein
VIGSDSIAFRHSQKHEDVTVSWSWMQLYPFQDNAQVIFGPYAAQFVASLQNLIVLAASSAHSKSLALWYPR